MDEKDKEIKRLRAACILINESVCQTLGKALGYPWFKDDQENFPGTTEAQGVCVGEHVAETIAEEAAKRIRALEQENQNLISIIISHAARIFQ